MAEKGRFRQELRAGERLFHEGDPGDCAYLVEAGAIDVKRKQDAKVIGTVKAGELLGEMALLDGRPRTAGAVAREASSVRVITREHLKERLRESDPLLRHLLHLILERYRAAMGVSGESLIEPEHDLLRADREEALRRLRDVQELEAGLTRNELALGFQPVVRLRDGRTAGFDVGLAGAQAGRLASAQQSALAIELGRWMLPEACAALARVAAGASPPLWVAVHVAGRWLADPAFGADVLAALEKSGLPGQQLLLAVAEAELMHNVEAAVAALAPLRNEGVHVAASGFGVGDSSLSKLYALPLDLLQVHRSFIASLEQDKRGGEVLKVIAALAHALGVGVIVDGVESTEQATFLNRYGFEFAQGPLYAAGVPEKDAAALVQKTWS